jgi:hypothetical protein
MKPRIIAVPVALAWLACGAGWAIDSRQFYASYLVAFMYFLTIALGAAFFVMVEHLSGAVWSRPVQRPREIIMATLPLAPLLFLPVMAGIPTLYEWARPEFHSGDPVLQVKMIFFNPAFFLARAAVYFLIWSVLAVVLYRRSVAVIRWSGPGLVLLAVTVTMAAVDWLMSLEPHWYSTIFGIYIFAGGGLAFMAALILVCQLRGRAAPYHDLGTWLFVLVVFWAYIGFCQYLLIWYANLPEETVWYKHRLEGNWAWVSAALLVGNFILPFLLLISRAAKRNLRLLGAASALLLVMHYVDLHWVAMPTFHPRGFQLHWLDLATFVAVGGAYSLAGRIATGVRTPSSDLVEPLR